MKYQYSLIIPHYNIPKLLVRLLRTIPKREDLQVIVVDDCSPEQTQSELEDIKKTFPDIEFYSSGTNGGGGKARNIGLSHALGKYVLFADADDFFLPSIYDILSQYADTNADIIFLNAGSCDNDTYHPSDRNQFLNYYHALIDTNYELAIQKLKYTFGEPWCKIVKREIITSNSIKFQETPCHNDTYFSYMVGYHSKSILVDHRVAYMVTYRKNSVINTNFSNRNSVMMTIFTKKERFFIENNINDHAYNPFDYIITEFFHWRHKNIRKAYSMISKELPKSYVNRILIKRFFQRINYALSRHRAYGNLD